MPATKTEIAAVLMPLATTPAQRATVRRYASKIAAAALACDCKALETIRDSSTRAGNRGTVSYALAGEIDEQARIACIEARAWASERKIVAGRVAMRQTVDTSTHNGRAAAQYAKELALAGF